MKFRMGKAGPLVLAGVAIYVGAMVLQDRAATNLCEGHPIGSPIDNLENIESFFLKRMGPIPEPDVPGAQFAVFCSAMTLCDTSCRLTVKDGLVIENNFSAH